MKTDYSPILRFSIEATISENVKCVFPYNLNYSKDSKCFDECIFNMQSARGILKDDIVIVIVINTTECTFFSNILKEYPISTCMMLFWSYSHTVSQHIHMYNTYLFCTHAWPASVLLFLSSTGLSPVHLAPAHRRLTRSFWTSLLAGSTRSLVSPSTCMRAWARVIPSSIDAKGIILVCTTWALSCVLGRGRWPPRAKLRCSVSVLADTLTFTALPPSLCRSHHRDSGLADHQKIPQRYQFAQPACGER